MWSDQLADRKAISTVFMLFSPVLIDGDVSVPAVVRDVKYEDAHMSSPVA